MSSKKINETKRYMTVSNLKYKNDKFKMHSSNPEMGKFNARLGHQVNWTTVKMTSSAWFDYVKESFS